MSPKLLVKLSSEETLAKTKMEPTGNVTVLFSKSQECEERLF